MSNGILVKLFREMVFINLWSVIHWYVRPIVKWILRKTTRLCELQRICYGDRAGAQRTCNVENSLMLSRTRDVREVTAFLDAVVLERRFVPQNFDDVLYPSINIILRTKQVNTKLHPKFVPAFKLCLQQIWSYRQLQDEIEELRCTPYDSKNIYHEIKLLKLWSLLQPNEKLKDRITKQWQDIGFQVW